uniref:SCP domain-containing protein n=1 Tax=Angiostrongylus cantonensis TaxID=6313 RepID=A0A0K0DQP1_ANGCA
MNEFKECKTQWFAERPPDEQTTLAPVYKALLQSGECNGGFKKPFGCRGTAISDQKRDDVLSFFNFIRASVALGEYRGFSLSPASDMNKLRWDCDLEAVAEGAVQDCPEHPSFSASTNAVNFNYYGPYMGEEVLKSPITMSMWKWGEIANASWPADNVFNGNEALRSFANMISANATAAGCYSATCGDRASSACFFSQPELQVGTLVYSSGNPCQNAGQCASPKNGVCENGLCVISV